MCLCANSQAGDCACQARCTVRTPYWFALFVSPDVCVGATSINQSFSGVVFLLAVGFDVSIVMDWLVLVLLLYSMCSE